MRPNEEQKNSDYSPGPVRSEESLLRVIFSPQHIDDHGKIRTEAISRNDLAVKGFSVQRHEFVTKARINILIHSYISRKPEERAYKGIGSLVCGKIRQIEDSNAEQALVVLDDAHSPEDIAHAAIKYHKADCTRAEGKKIRNKLLEHLTPVRSLKEIFPE